MDCQQYKAYRRPTDITGREASSLLSFFVKFCDLASKLILNVLPCSSLFALEEVLVVSLLGSYVYQS